MPSITKTEARRRGYRRGKYYLHSVAFPKNQFTARAAAAWLKKHGKHCCERRATKTQWRFYQGNPSFRGGRWATIKLPNGVSLISCKY